MSKELRNPTEPGWSGDASSRNRCLVLAAPDTAVSGALLSALSRRGLGVHMVANEPEVMVELAGDDCAVVVAVDPQAWPRLGELAYAIRQHYPDVRCWQFADHQDKRPRLGELHPQYLGPRPPKGSGVYASADSREEAKDTSHAPRYGAGPDDDQLTGPIGKIEGRRRAVSDLAVKAPDGPSPSSALVSSEELTMLLGPTPGEAS